MQKTKEMSVFLDNKPGRLTNVCSSLAGSKINITAITVAGASRKTVVRFVTDDMLQTRKILKQLNIPYEEADVLSVEMRNQPGALAQVCETLSSEHISIEHAYCSVGAKNGKVVGIFRVSNPPKALKVLAESPGSRARRGKIRRPSHEMASKRKSAR